MNVTKIVVPTDFSTMGETALNYASALARDTGAMLLIVHVEEPPIAYGAGEFYALPAEPDSAALREALEAVVPTDPTVRCEHRLLLGDPAHEIVQLAATEGADMIVLGTHGRTGLRRLLMGSVAEAVVRRAGCPVLTIKQPEHAAVED